MTQDTREDFSEALKKFLPAGWDRLTEDQLFERQVVSERSRLPKVNVLMIGNSGAGKSTLINSILGVPLAPVGSGQPVTMKVDVYTDDSIPIRLFDTRGIELGEDRKSTVARLYAIVKESYLSDDEPIHVALYCVLEGQARFLDFDEQVVRDLAKHLPVFLVLTQCYADKDDKKVVDLAESILARNMPIVGRRVFRTLAERCRIGGVWLEPHGLGELVGEIYRVLPEALKHSFASSQSVRIDMKISEARKEVIKAAGAAGAIGAAPIPDVGPLMALQVGMLGKIHVAMGLEVDARSMMGSLLPVFGTMITGRTASKIFLSLFPGVGYAINGVIASTLTGAMGEAYIQACGRALRKIGDSPGGVSAVDVQELIIEEVQDGIGAMRESAMKRLKELKPFGGFFASSA